MNQLKAFVNDDLIEGETIITLKDRIKNKILKMFAKEKLKAIFIEKKRPVLFILIISILICIGSVLATKFTLESMYSSKKEFKVSIYERLDELKKSHNYYKKIATREEFIVKWIEMFSGATYKNDGDPKKGEYDCLGAVVEYLRRWGANVKLENIPLIIQRTELLSKLNQLDIRKSIREVRPGDIVIFKPVKGIYHLGVIWNTTPSGDILYMDMNSRTSIGFETLNFGSDKIFRVMEVSFSFWYGNHMESLNK
jgi:hypothetical protein